MGAIRRVSFRECQGEAEHCKEFQAETIRRSMVNVQALERVQPKDLDASEMRSKAWGNMDLSGLYYRVHGRNTPYAHDSPSDCERIKVQYAEVTGQWNVKGKNVDSEQ